MPDHLTPDGPGFESAGEHRRPLGDPDNPAIDSFGEPVLSAGGLDLPIDVTEAKNDPAPLQATPEELAALAETEAELDARWPETKIEPSLTRIALLMDLLGHPEKSFRSIHVAGTNGKTSTVRMIESLLRAFHRRTGRTTSPHLQSVTERIAIDGTPIAARDYVRLWREIKPYVEMVDTASEKEGGPMMSKFEVLTALAYAAFADAPVDVAVVEVGMGGRWDATNVIDSDVAVVMPVGLDHTDYLGETVEEIAGEKAGIIKPKVKDPDDVLEPDDNVAVVALQEAAAMKVILAQAVKADSAVARFGQEFGVAESVTAVGGQLVTLTGLGGTYEEIFLPLSGAHQAHNAACALAAVEAFFGAGAGRKLDIDMVREGFATVTSPGRLERVRATPTVFADATHNPQGAKALAASLADDFEFRRLIAVVACFADKDVRGILRELEPVVDEIVVTENFSPRAMPVDELAGIAREIFGDERVHTAGQLVDAVDTATALAEDPDNEGGPVSGSGIIITGSVVTAGQARTLFGKEPA
ncbi:bifunctional folylpolyglutamate synthase/dihydrofolate synthase [Corynebacterium mendelii]|uniref:Dihydrofolate synthase/folylpolyglutamate synthase n=1 Tax=Corynebacterium mendelii TaxID=2765362 RepID=A0A939IXK9_9CORY|nr:folylpolyglutamate synthase/dihydrofolate synthase family protein [Corynebacterium mendelii]MBN9644168.1 bifunctional folylpolyglutamate synthase/dihydrofolate synthase [Corynebacterium mendelii]